MTFKRFLKYFYIRKEEYVIFNQSVADSLNPALWYCVMLCYAVNLRMLQKLSSFCFICKPFTGLRLDHWECDCSSSWQTWQRPLCLQCSPSSPFACDLWGCLSTLRVGVQSLKDMSGSSTHLDPSGFLDSDSPAWLKICETHASCTDENPQQRAASRTARLYLLPRLCNWRTYRKVPLISL